MRRLLDWFGSGFVYRSPTNKIEGWRRNAMYMSSRQLRDLSGISAHYSKAVIVNRFINENFSKNDYD
jgi:hypothetical protein